MISFPPVNIFANKACSAKDYVEKVSYPASSKVVLACLELIETSLGSLQLMLLPKFTPLHVLTKPQITGDKVTAKH